MRVDASVDDTATMQGRGNEREAAKGSHMTDDRRQPISDELDAEELAQETAAELPDREAMSLINANIAVPVNAAVAANVLSDNSTAIAEAIQEAQIDQSN
jgi:hypothetical protein